MLIIFVQTKINSNFQAMSYFAEAVLQKMEAFAVQKQQVKILLTTSGGVKEKVGGIRKGSGAG